MNLEATAKFQRYDIGMRISGPLEEMDLQLNSSPPLTKDQIVRMLTLQREATGSEGVDSDDLQNLMTAGLEMAVFGDVEQIFKEALGLDEFRVYSGKLRLVSKWIHVVTVSSHLMNVINIMFYSVNI